MSLTLNTNTGAYDAHLRLLSTENQLAQSMQKLSTGYQINQAADDAAGLALSEKLESQIGGLDQAQRNGQDAISLVQTAEGSLQQVHAMLQRVRELAVEYRTGTASASDKAALQSEVSQLASEIERIGEAAQFNGISLLAGTATVTFQIGAEMGETVSVALPSLGAIVPPSAFDFGAGATISGIDAAIEGVSGLDASLGAVENRLQSVLDNASVADENLQSSSSQIKDVDMAAEMTRYTKLQILEQAGVAALAQANSQPQSVLALLKG